MTVYYSRDIGGLVSKALSEMPVVVISGMRQTGKTTLLQRQPGLRARRYVTFDDFAQLEAAKADPDRFVASDEPLTIDEAHKCPEVLTAIKRAVDKKRVAGRFLLSGSASFAMLKGVSESLAGRALYLVLHPFNRREIRRRAGRVPFIRSFFDERVVPKIKGLQPITPREVLTGGMPSVCLGEVKDASLWFKGYEQTYLERDVRAISGIGNIMAFRNLLRLAVMRTGQLMSPSEVGRDAKLNATTTSRYLSVLEASFVLRRVGPYLRNKTTRLIKSPKMYTGDSGLAGFLSGVSASEVPADLPLFPALFETYVAVNLLGILDATWPAATLHFWNVQGRYEVDFVIEAGRHCLAVEVKSGGRWEDRDLSGLRAFLAATPHCKAAVLSHNGTEAVQLGEKLWALPTDLILS